jgi:ribosomal protein S18 acetylase RimI-like enzyme
MVKFRAATPDDREEIVPLLYKSSTDLIEYTYGSLYKPAQDLIGLEFSEGSGIFGYKSLLIAEMDGKIVGCLTAYEGSKFKKLSLASFKNVFKFYSFIEFLIIVKRMMKMNGLFEHPSSQAVYIANGYVDESCRQPGVFSGLVDAAETKAKSSNLPYLECDVSYMNDRSLKVHQFFGFEIIKENPYKGKEELLDGFRRLRLIIEN